MKKRKTNAINKMMKTKSQSRQEAAYRRRSAVTIIEDSIRLADERADCEGGRSAFWDNEAARMRWVLKIIQTHPLGKVKAGE